MTTHRQPLGVPRTAGAIRTAAAVRRQLDLPQLNVVAVGEDVRIEWVDGPSDVVAMGRLHERGLWCPPLGMFQLARRVDAVTFAAAMLEVDSPRCLGRRVMAWNMLDARDLDAHPLPTELLRLGGLLAGLSDVPAGAVVGGRGESSDWAMLGHLMRLGGPDTLVAIGATPAVGGPRPG